MPSRWTRSYVSSQKTEEVLAALIARGRGRSDAIRVLAARYAEVVERHRPRLTDGEWVAVKDALSSSRYDEPSHIRMIPIAVSDAIEDSLAGRHGINAVALQEKIDGCSYAELLSIASEVGV